MRSCRGWIRHRWSVGSTALAVHPGIASELTVSAAEVLSMVADARRDTIIAPATAMAESGVAIVRISGPRAARVLRTWFKPRRPNCRWTSHRLYFGSILDPASGTRLDEGLAVLMRSPRSYTGEDVAEIHCHGSPELIRMLLDRGRQEGLRLAHPGEFTQRAVLNGRMDLAQAESVLEAITARSERAVRQAASGLAGAFSQAVESIRSDLVRTQAFLEASIDFTEDEIPPEDIDTPVSGALAAVVDLQRRAHHGLLFRSGVRVAIVGRPNVGKSSLLNALLRSARAIVTDIPGTTRDTLEERVVLHGIPMVLVDTAGIREADDVVERIGIDRARSAMADAAIQVLVLDASAALTTDDRHLLNDPSGATRIIVLNKGDLPPRLRPEDLDGPVGGRRVLAVSALGGIGMAELERALADLSLELFGGAPDDETVLAVPRHLEALGRAEGALRGVLVALQAGQPPDIAAGELSLATRALGEITGVNATEDLYDTIFTRFCLGK